MREASPYSSLAKSTARWCGKPHTFALALGVIVTWIATGPLFGFSDTWQLVINTGTTIITFLMVFLIQNTQNRDQMAMQIKLAELIVHMKGAQNRMAFVRSPDQISFELLQRGEPLAPAEPWASMPNVGSW